MSDSVSVRLLGTGRSLPPKVLTNAELSASVDTSDEWIATRTGIRERRIVSNGQTTMSLGAESAKEALAAAGVEPQDIDLVICATICQEMPFPSTACLIQNELGISGGPAFDLAAACSGFVYAWVTADQMLRCGPYKRALVIGSETMTQWVDFTDRRTCILFGDGAGSVVLEASDEPGGCTLYHHLGADGSGWHFMNVPGGGSRGHNAEDEDEKSRYIYMRGGEIYKFAVNKMAWLIRDCLEKTNLSVDDIKLVVPHQVNSRIIDSACSRLGFPSDKVMVNIDRYGNTSSASIPIALDEAVRSGAVSEGDTIIFVAFGAGLTWGSAVVKL